jgi:hypothetical protein
MGRICSTHVEKKNAYRVLAGTQEGKRPLERPRHKWDYNIKMCIRQIGWDDTDWIHLAQDKDQWRDLVNTIMNIRVP